MVRVACPANCLDRSREIGEGAGSIPENMVVKKREALRRAGTSPLRRFFAALYSDCVPAGPVQYGGAR